MNTGKGKILELILMDGIRHARIACPSNLIPTPGQYLLSNDASLSPLPIPLYQIESLPESFLTAPIPDSWNPGDELTLRGPLGRGFDLPAAARRVALVAFDSPPSYLRGLIAPALKQGAAVALVTAHQTDHIPDDVEVHPLDALGEILRWADWSAVDVARENLPEWRKMIGMLNQTLPEGEAVYFIRVPVLCGGIAECGVCAIPTKSGWQMGCKDSVFKIDQAWHPQV